MSTIVASEPEAGMPAESRLVAKKLNSADRAESRRSQFASQGSSLFLRTGGPNARSSRVPGVEIAGNGVVRESLPSEKADRVLMYVTCEGCRPHGNCTNLTTAIRIVKSENRRL